MSGWPIKVLHLGLGRFHRAHQALYFQSLYERTGTKWGLASFSMRSPDARDEMRRVHNHYPVVEFSRDEARLRWVDAIRASYFIQEDREAFLDLFQSVELVTLTVTEKAYDSDDLYHWLLEGLKQRTKPLTILSCDNLLGNGNKLRAGLLQRAENTAWIEKNVTFPNSMVDRIVPALTPERIKELQAQFETDNPEILATETFSQWVIEDKFAAAKPPIAAEFVEDVKPFEEMKLRLLNASHSLIAYAGLRKGYRFVHEAIRDAEIRGRVEELYREVTPLVHPPEDYTASLLERFDNERLPHQLKQIAMDGSQKLKQRIVPSLKQTRDNRALESVIEDWAYVCYETTPDDPMKAKIEEWKTKSFPEFQRELRSLIEAP